MNNNQKTFFSFLIFLIILGTIQFSTENIIGFDGYYNIKIAETIKKNGFFEEFGWITNSILSQNYANIQVLFHILLVPFTFLDLQFGAKLFTIMSGAIAFVVFYWFLLQNKIKYSFFWTLLYLFSSSALMYRFMLPRQMPITISLLLLTIYFLQEKKYWYLGITSLIFSLFYSGFILQLLIIGVYFWINYVFSKKIEYKLLLYPLIGSFLGLVINPYFPQNISFLYSQIFEVNLASNLFNVEWKPWTIIEFLKNNILTMIYLSATLLILIKNKKLSKNNFFFFSVAIFFFGYTLLARRMQEYLVPFSILALVFVIKNSEFKIQNTKYLKILGITLITVLVTVNSFLLIKNIKNNDFLNNYKNCAEWMQKNVEKDSLIFINAYSFPYLFMENSDVRYTHGIDLGYSYLYDKEKFERYMEMFLGTYSGEDIIVSDYDADYVFSGKVKQDIKLFEHIIKNKKNYQAMYEDEWCAVLKIKKIK